MPIYSFRCPKCGTTAEELRSIEQRDDLPRCYCTAYSSTSMQRLITAPASIWHPTKTRGGWDGK